MYNAIKKLFEGYTMYLGLFQGSKLAVVSRILQL